MVNLVVLNAGNIELARLILILFILVSFEKLIKSGDGMFTSFIQPLIADLKTIFVKQIKVIYNYIVIYN